MPKYDVVVVGAGNAGLAASLTLLKNNKKVLLIEQHNLPGGCATSFVRGRFEFDASLHELADVGTRKNPGGLRNLMDYFGVNIEWVRIPDCFRVISYYSDGTPMDVTMPSGAEKFIEAMEYYVPGSKASMVRLFRLIDEVRAGVNYVSLGESSNDVLIKEHGNFLRTGAYSCLKVFKAVGLPQKAIDIISTYWSYLGVDLGRMNFVHYGMMLRAYIDEGASIPKKTSHEISVAMTERIRELGGDIWFNCRAESFSFSDGKLNGVFTTAGFVECNYALANINPDIVYSKMVPAELVPTWQKKLSNARNHNYSGRMYTCYFGLDCKPEEVGIRDYSIFFYGTADSVSEQKKIDSGFINDDFFIMICNNIVNPNASPAGTCIVSLTTFTIAEDWNNVEPSKYGWQKSKVASELVRELKERGGIDISNHIEEMETASPLTFARYLNVPEGCVYGFETSGWDGIVARIMTASDECCIPGLRTIGAAGSRGDGYSMAYANGREVANILLSDINKNVEEASNE